jgi:hypothetical protein
MLEDEPLSNEIRLKNRVSILCFPFTAPSLRGWSIPVGVMDEVGYRWEQRAELNKAIRLPWDTPDSFVFYNNAGE